MLIRGDARHIPLRDGSVHCVVTSPPYWGLRDYKTPGQIGLECTPEEYVATMVAVFREVRRVLRADGVLWLNLGDSYAGSRGAQSREHAGKHAPNVSALSANQVKAAQIHDAGTGSLARTPGLKPKDLVGIPWRVAFALQADGWYLRRDVIWAKPNPMPESVTDRPTTSHEYVLLLTKAARYFYDAEAVREPDSEQDHPRSVLDGQPSLEPTGGLMSPHKGLRQTEGRNGSGRNLRSVWTIPTQPYSGAHFATFPEALVKRCILAGCPQGGIVLDPFVGSGTTVRVARSLGREGIGLDLNADYLAKQATRRIQTTQGLPF